MSWSLASTTTSVDKIDEALDAVVESPPSDKAEQQEQVKAAKAAIKSLIDSGAVASSGPISFVAGGHANPDHKPVSGYANDQISVSVYQLTETHTDA